MKDSYGRQITYMRFSITDRCDYRCRYCMPKEGIEKKAKQEILTYEEILKIVKAGNHLGIDKVRLTGGEPLCRKDLPYLIRSIRKECQVKDLSLTTNGSRLAKLASNLAKSGLDRINVSLDSVNPSTFEEITRAGKVKEVLRGIERAKEVGLDPIKLNCVPLRGVNENEIDELISFAIDRSLILRFIGLMPMGEVAHTNLEGVDRDELLRKIQANWTIETTSPPQGNGPAQYYLLGNSYGQTPVGLIYPEREKFCRSCNKIRITSQGMARPCLAHDDLIPLGDLNSVEAIEDRLSIAIENKPADHQWGEQTKTEGEMSNIGG